MEHSCVGVVATWNLRGFSGMLPVSVVHTAKAQLPESIGMFEFGGLTISEWCLFPFFPQLDCFAVHVPYPPNPCKSDTSDEWNKCWKFVSRESSPLCVLAFPGDSCLRHSHSQHHWLTGDNAALLTLRKKVLQEWIRVDSTMCCQFYNIFSVLVYRTLLKWWS